MGVGFGDASLAVAGGVEYGTPSINTVQPITIPVELDFRFALSGVLGQGGPCLGDRVEHLCFNMVAVVDAAYFYGVGFLFLRAVHGCQSGCCNKQNSNSFTSYVCNNKG